MNSIEIAYQEFCDERFQLPSEKQVAELEKRIGVRLPADYRQFLLDYNGGVFTNPEFLSPDKSCPPSRLLCMKGIGTKESATELASKVDLALFDDNDPPQLLPIGYTPMNNLILLVTHPEDNGAIILKTIHQGAFFLAAGIKEFFSLLRKPSDD